jgi:hypothetical protein
MVTLTLKFPDGSTATITGRRKWKSDSAEIAAILNAQNTSRGAASYLPHRYLHVAEWAVAQMGAELKSEGEDDSKEGEIN